MDEGPKETLSLIQTKEDLEVLTNNIPGGIFKCLFNKELTILYMSEGFLSMFGYTRQEIQERFHNSFWEMIDPRDRNKSMNDVQKQMNKGHNKEIEYRVVSRSGKPIWVLDKGQLIQDQDNTYPTFYCIIVDITEEKKTREELNLSLERYNIIMAQTNDVLLEWDMTNDQLRFSKNWEVVIGQRNIIKSVRSLFEDNAQKIFLPQDIEKLKKITQRIISGEQYLEEELRILTKEHGYQWWRARLTVQFNDASQPVKVIGILVDIDQQKRQSQYLLDQSRLDALTGIYNKMTAQNKIKDDLESLSYQEVSALMIIDIDNFKEVNDRLGHLFGDSILSDIAREIQKNFYSDDIIGRIGGDEFIAFVKNLQSIENIQRKANQIIKEMSVLQKSYDREVPISCSIGIAIIPRDGREFSELFQKADKALYKAKNEGKNQFVIYNEKIMQEYLMNTQLRSLINETIDSNEDQHVLSSQLAEYVFKVLYNSQDVTQAVSTILEIIGRQLDVSRVYIFENSDDDQYCCNTFEWCHYGVEPQQEMLKQLSYKEDLGGTYMDNFNEEGIFYCSDITALPSSQFHILDKQNIKSMLQCAIMDNGTFKGYVGFDECRNNRYWTQEQIDALVFISEIMSVFLLKKHVEMTLQRKTDSLLELLNYQDSAIYVIDAKSYELLFINKKTKTLFPHAQMGVYCYQTFMQRDIPCDNCPASYINAECLSKRVEFINPHVDVLLDVDASSIKWDDRQIVMLNCRDITKYWRKEE